MKRLFFIVTALFALNAFSFAQTKEKEKAKPGKVQMTTKTGTPKITDKAAGATGNVTVTKVKKDGTADMRYKENKEAPKITPNNSTHVKKDGTPDKRYKENKKKG